MHYKVLSICLLGLSTLASGFSSSHFISRQSDDFPECAVSCLDSSPTGNCSIYDDACLCQDPTYLKALTACIVADCDQEEADIAADDGVLLCAEFGITVSLSVTGSGGTASTVAATTSNDNVNGASSSTGAASNPAVTQTQTETSEFTQPTTSAISTSGSGSGPGDSGSSGDSGGLGGLTKGSDATSNQIPLFMILAACLGLTLGGLCF